MSTQRWQVAGRGVRATGGAGLAGCAGPDPPAGGAGRA